MSSLLQSRRLPTANRFVDSSSDDEDDEERRLQEEEEERLLTEQYGEAAEAPRNKRDAPTDQEIEAEYQKATRKKPRRTLTPADLIGSRGLIRIRHEFPKIRYPGQKRKDAAKTYSRSLVNAYKSFCCDLFPGMAFEDVLARIETFGSKKEVKTYLQSMRDEIRDAHLEKVVGKEKASRMLEELEHGLKQQHNDMDYEIDASDSFPTANHRESNGARVPFGSQKEPVREEVFRETPSPTEQVVASPNVSPAVAEALEEEKDFLQDSDDELEIEFPATTSRDQDTKAQAATCDTKQTTINSHGNTETRATEDDLLSVNDVQEKEKEAQSVNLTSSPNNESVEAGALSKTTVQPILSSESEDDLESKEERSEEHRNVSPNTVDASVAEHFISEEANTSILTVTTHVERPNSNVAERRPPLNADNATLLPTENQVESLSSGDETFFSTRSKMGEQ